MRTPFLFAILLSLGSCHLTKEAGFSVRARVLEENPEHSKRCLLVFDQLRSKLKRGMTSKEVAAALGETEWLDEVYGTDIQFIGGSLPVDFAPDKKVFWVSLYANRDNWSNYVVIFSLTSELKYYETFTIEEFIGGELESDKVRVHQFALLHPSTSDFVASKMEVYPKGAGREPLGDPFGDFK